MRGVERVRGSIPATAKEVDDREVPSVLRGPSQHSRLRLNRACVSAPFVSDRQEARGGQQPGPPLSL